jgi:hypothetical protein
LDKQSENELRIFKKFAEKCPYPIDFKSIEKRNPPEPDIFCQLSDSTSLTFELVECIDSSLSRSIYNSCELAKAFYEQVEKLPKHEKKRIKSHFQILVSVVFEKGITIRKKRSLIKPIFDLLWTEENEIKIRSMQDSFSVMTPEEAAQFAEILEKENITKDELLKRAPFSKAVPQSFDLKIPKKLKDDVKRITFFLPGLSGGPSFDITEAVWIYHPIEKRVRDKLKKKYVTENAKELLVYYELQPELPDNKILAELEFIDLNNTIFRRLWIYSVTEDRIIYNPLDFLIGASLAVPEKGIIKDKIVKDIVQQKNLGDRE